MQSAKTAFEYKVEAIYSLTDKKPFYMIDDNMHRILKSMDTFSEIELHSEKTAIELRFEDLTLSSILFYTKNVWQIQSKFELLDESN